MDWQFSPYVIPLIIGVIPLFGLAIIAWRRGDSLDIRLFCLNAISTGFMILAYVMEMLSASEAGIRFWLKVEYIFYYTPALWLLFVLAYTGHEKWVTPRRVLLLFLPSILHTLSAWTNEIHHLNWATAAFREVDGLLLFQPTYGPSFIAASIYYFVLITAMVGVTLNAYLRAAGPYRRQFGLLLLAVSFPAMTYVMTLSRVSPVPYFDLTPFGFLIAYGFIGWSLLRDRLLDLVPTARHVVVNSITDMILVVDVQGRLMDINPAGERFIGRPAAKMIGRPVMWFFPALPNLVPSPQDRGVSEIEVTHDGTCHTFGIRISSITKRGDLRGHVIVLHNITERKRIEETVRQYAAELEARNRELDAFTSTVAHDLKTPLQIILGYTELLLDNEGHRLSVMGKEYVSYMQESANRMRDMITGLLLLAQLRDASTALTRVDMARVTQQVLSRLHGDIQRHGIMVTVDPNLPEAYGHPIWLEEALANLAGNAVKYIGKNNPAPTIAIRGGRQNDCVWYEVTDNGIGINPDDQARLFDMFTRFHPHEANGTGIGLSIVQRIITKLNGTIEIESAPGAGSTFRIRLPAPPPALTPPAATESAERAEQVHT